MVCHLFSHLLEIKGLLQRWLNSSDTALALSSFVVSALTSCNAYEADVSLDDYVEVPC